MLLFPQILHLFLAKKRLQRDNGNENLSAAQLQSLSMADGSKLEDLDLTFMLPGSATIELKKNGDNYSVTPHNIGHYLQLVTQWILREGVYRQAEAFREGKHPIYE